MNDEIRSELKRTPKELAQVWLINVPQDARGNDYDFVSYDDLDPGLLDKLDALGAEVDAGNEGVIELLAKLQIQAEQDRDYRYGTYIQFDEHEEDIDRLLAESGARDSS